MQQTFTEQQYADMFRWADDMVRTVEPEKALAPVISIDTLRQRRERGNEAA